MNTLMKQIDNSYRYFDNLVRIWFHTAKSIVGWRYRIFGFPFAHTCNRSYNITTSRVVNLPQLMKIKLWFLLGSSYGLEWSSATMMCKSSIPRLSSHHKHQSIFLRLDLWFAIIQNSWADQQYFLFPCSSDPSENSI